MFAKSVRSTLSWQRVEVLWVCLQWQGQLAFFGMLYFSFFLSCIPLFCPTSKTSFWRGNHRLGTFQFDEETELLECISLGNTPIIWGLSQEKNREQDFSLPPPGLSLKKKKKNWPRVFCGPCNDKQNFFFLAHFNVKQCCLQSLSARRAGGRLKQRHEDHHWTQTL